LAKIAYLLLCHKRPDRVLEQVRVLTQAGDYVAVHADLNAGKQFGDKIAKGIAGNPHAVMADRVKCGWGEWSLVRASLNMIGAAIAAFPGATHFFLVSGDCMPVKPASFIRQALDDTGLDWIEHAEFFDGDWIQTGMKAERVTRRHYFNERTQRRRFYASLEIQRKLGIERMPPRGLKMRIGSQWWVLRRSTVEKVMDFVKARKDVRRFFATTWIPDETFFQTLVMHLVPREEVMSRPPTYLVFSDYGMPVTFSADHFGLLRAEDAFFARKISDYDDALRQRLGDLYLSDESIAETSSNGRGLYDFIRERGRKGRRFAPRIWESQATLGMDRRVSVLVCKKWHVAKRIAAQLSSSSKLKAFGYVFEEDDAGLPPLGNLSSTREKRKFHRRAFLNALFEIEEAGHIAICLDPGDLAAINDLDADGCQLDVIHIACRFDREWIAGHAMRVGLGSQVEAGGMHGQLLGALEQTIKDEVHGLRSAGIERFEEIEEGMTPGQMAGPLANTFGISIDEGARLARTEHLFD